jgi:hypothetical protein
MKPVGRITFAERGKNVTAVVTVTAAETFIPLMIFDPRLGCSHGYLLDLFLG